MLSPHTCIASVSQTYGARAGLLRLRALVCALPARPYIVRGCEENFHILRLRKWLYILSSFLFVMMVVIGFLLYRNRQSAAQGMRVAALIVLF